MEFLENIFLDELFMKKSIIGKNITTSEFQTFLRQNIFIRKNILYPYTAERRDVFGNTSHEDREISRGWEFFSSRLPEGNLEGQRVQNPREISRSVGDAFPNTSRLKVVYSHSLSITRKVLTLLCVVNCHQ